MLTGDKIETAKCIAISCGLQSPENVPFEITGIKDKQSMEKELKNLSNSPNIEDNILIIDGNSLNIALKEFEKFFMELSSQVSAVICCRCSPTQKATMTSLVKIFTKKIVAGIGDGGNDVGMIQNADVGIGVEGKEGKQASLASDFSLKCFSSINKLILWHGRLAYKVYLIKHF